MEPRTLQLDEEKSHLKNLPVLNFIWSGPLCDEKSLSENNRSGTLINQDLGQIAAIAKEGKNPVRFWCFDEHVEKYKQRFNELGCSSEEVKVCSIESHLKEGLKSSDENIKKIAQFILDRMQQLLSKDRGKIIDYITIKDMFAFYVLITEGGYTLDTNIAFGSKAKARGLPEFSTFCAPWDSSCECWAMFAPKECDALKKTFIASYLEVWPYIDAIFKMGPYHALYHSMLSQTIIGVVEPMLAFNPMRHTFYNPLPENAELQEWNYTSVPNNNDQVVAPGLGIIKTYNNTHKSQKTLEQRWEDNLTTDNVTFFKERYFNSVDLQLILNIAKECPDAKKCTIYLTDKLSQQEKQEQNLKEYKVGSLTAQSIFLHRDSVPESPTSTSPTEKKIDKDEAAKTGIKLGHGKLGEED